MDITPYALTYYVEESVGLSSAICLAFNVSHSMNLLKYFYKVCFIKRKSYLM